MTDNFAQWRKDAEKAAKFPSGNHSAIQASRVLDLLDLVEKARGLLGDDEIYADLAWLEQRDAFLSDTASIKDTTDEAG